MLNEQEKKLVESLVRIAQDTTKDCAYGARQMATAQRIIGLLFGLDDCNIRRIMELRQREE